MNNWFPLSPKYGILTEMLASTGVRLSWTDFGNWKPLHNLFTRGAGKPFQEANFLIWDNSEDNLAGEQIQVVHLIRLRSQEVR